MIICDAVFHPLLFQIVLIPTHSVNYSALEGAVGALSRISEINVNLSHAGHVLKQFGKYTHS